jgi:hypothetical protein
MKVGDEIICKHCGENSFLVKKTIMDGWTKVGEVLTCSSCSMEIEKICNEEKLSEKQEIKSLSLDKLSGFLGTELEEKPTINMEEDEKYFCRDCKHYISHPFLDRCSLHQTEVNPMDDCKSFER